MWPMDPHVKVTHKAANTASPKILAMRPTWLLLALAVDVCPWS